MTLIKTIIIWCGMHYATPQWMEQQLPPHFKTQYDVYIVPYGTPLSQIKQNIDPNTTALMGFSAGALDVFKNYNPDYAFIGLIDPSTRIQYKLLEYNKNTHMMYNPLNWGNINKSLETIAHDVMMEGGESIEIHQPHNVFPKYFFQTYFGI